MTQEEKQLLLKDLCARLPYRVLCKCLHSNIVKATAIDTEDLSVYYFDCDEWESIEHCKPYLRPMSSMTEEELHEYNMHLLGITTGVDAMNFMFWIYQRHLYILHFIEKNLAIEAPEGMYNL